jgi:hypothetical protein
MWHYFKIIAITSDKNYLLHIKINYYVHNYFFIEHNYSHSAIYNFKPELKFWKYHSVVKIIILLILISQIIIYYYYY